MALKINDVFKLLVSDVIDTEKDYEYYICIAHKEDYSILHELEQYYNLNGYADQLELIDIDERFADATELNIKHFKKLNGLESIYYDSKEVEQPEKIENKRRFKVV